MFGDLRAWALLPLAAPLVLQNLPPWPRLSQRDAGLDNINGAHHVLETSQRPPHTKELPGTLVVIPHGGVFARARPGTASRTPSLLRPAAPTVRASAAAVPPQDPPWELEAPEPSGPVNAGGTDAAGSLAASSLLPGESLSPLAPS